MMTVTLTTDLRPWRRGDDVHLPDDVADRLIANGEAENKRPFMTEYQTKVMTPEQPVEQAYHVKRGPGRPRK